MDKKNVIVGIGSSIIASILSLFLAKEVRKKTHTTMQDEVNNSVPKSNNDESLVSEDNVKFSLIQRGTINLDDYKEFEMPENEIREWKSLISTVVGEGVKIGMTGSAFSGLLKCDIPLKDLCRCKGSSDLMRGFVVDKRGIMKQGSFMEVGIGNATPLLVFQLMAAVTSQYYQHVITEQLNVINSKLNHIIDHLESADRAELRAAYERFVEISTKIKFDIADKVIVDNFSKDVNGIRLKYKELLKNSEKELDTSWAWTDKGEAEKKLKALEDSRYLNYLELAMQSELLYFIASLVSMRVAESLENEEDAKIYIKRLNFNFWDDYKDQFIGIRHKVVEYLNRQAKSSIFGEDEIKEKKEEVQKMFDATEIKMLGLQNQLNCRTQIVLQVQDNGEMKKLVLCGQS